MSGGQIALIMFAAAFLVIALALAFVLVVVVRRISKQVEQSLVEVNETVAIIKGEIKPLTNEVEALLTKSNVLLNDVNGKVAAIDPVFTAIGELGESVSDLNISTRNLAERVTTGTKNAAKVTVAAKVGQKAMALLNKKNAKTD